MSNVTLRRGTYHALTVMIALWLSVSVIAFAAMAVLSTGNSAADNVRNSYDEFDQNNHSLPPMSSDDIQSVECVNNPTNAIQGTCTIAFEGLDSYQLLVPYDHDNRVLWGEAELSVP